MVNLPEDLAGFRGYHAGETLLVCGCGRSLHELVEPQRWLTIGVNDVGRLFDPTYLVVLNPRYQFKVDRYRFVETSRAKAIFSQLDLRITHPHRVRFRLGQRGGVDLSDLDSLPCTQNSPYVALCLAAFMGATRIGLIGVDFTDHHFFAETGRHPLVRRLEKIDGEYRRLGEALAEDGIKVVNLSRESRLTAFPKGTLADLSGDPAARSGRSHATAEVSRPVSGTGPVLQPRVSGRGRKVFFVFYRFKFCGDVFSRGLERAAADLGLCWSSASCTDSRLLEKVSRFEPDLLFVVHGRTFRRRWGSRFEAFNSAVWLVDEPYEVDDTEGTSRLFRTVFVNDPSTLDRHSNSHYLPVAYDPHLHRSQGDDRTFDIGFIGGYSPRREQMLTALASENLLSYVVGGRWKSRRLQQLRLERIVPPTQTAALYGRTKVVINVFRDNHSYNRRRIEARSLNPRVFEALACGAVVLSQNRPELGEMFPALPAFEDPKELVAEARALLDDESRRRMILEDCRERLAAHTYGDRLRRVLEVVFPGDPELDAAGCTKSALPAANPRGVPIKTPIETPRETVPQTVQGVETGEVGCELTVIVGLRLPPSQPERSRNALAVLQSLAAQDLERSRYRVVVVEQDLVSRAADDMACLSDEWIFAFNPGAYNRGWGFNVGARRAEGEVLCLLDADLLVPSQFLGRAMEMVGATRPVVRPYREVVYLDESSTRRALADFAATAGGWATTQLPDQLPASYSGRRFTDSQGGTLWIARRLYAEIGGHDERFRGWGREDRELWNRLAAIKPIPSVPWTLWHLHHPRPAENDRWARANRSLYSRLRGAGPGVESERRDWGDVDRYRGEAVVGDVETDGARTGKSPSPGGRPGFRSWEHWHRWTPRQLQQQLRREQRLDPSRSARHRLALLVASLGSSILDLGCGPGALWPRLLETRDSGFPGLDWVGADITLGVLLASRGSSCRGRCQADGSSLPFAATSFDVVVVRHVLEHLPRDPMAATLVEACRVARQAVVVALHLPLVQASRISRTLPEGFLETRWSEHDVRSVVEPRGWLLDQRLSAGSRRGEEDEICIFRPASSVVKDPAPGAETPVSASWGVAEIPTAEGPLVSIVLPTYHRPKILPRAVRSILAQTYPRWQLIIVDNGGDLRHSFDDPRIEVFRYAEKSSSSYARNQGLSHVCGDLVCFFDDDDEMFPNYLEKLVGAFEANPRAQMVRCGMVLANGGVNHSYATPEVCLRRVFATPTWDNRGPCQDQRYFMRIVESNRWSERAGQIVTLPEALCKAHHAPVGGLRRGRF